MGGWWHRSLKAGESEAWREQGCDRSESGGNLGQVFPGEALAERLSAPLVDDQFNSVFAPAGAEFPGHRALDEAEDELFPLVFQVEVDLADDVPAGVRSLALQGEIDVEMETRGGRNHAFGGERVGFRGMFADAG